MRAAVTRCGSCGLQQSRIAASLPELFLHPLAAPWPRVSREASPLALADFFIPARCGSPDSQAAPLAIMLD